MKIAPFFLLIFCVTGGQIASAQGVTLRAITSFAEGTQFSANFERFIERVNKNGKGISPLNFGPDDSKAFTVKANDVAWRSVIAKSPEIGATFRQQRTLLQNERI